MLIYKVNQLKNLISDLDAVPENIRTAVRNNGGGHANHVFSGKSFTKWWR